MGTWPTRYSVRSLHVSVLAAFALGVCPVPKGMSGQAGGASPPVIQNMSQGPQTERGPKPIPGRVEAEDYDQMQGIDTESCSEGGENIGWQDPGDWFEFQVNVDFEGDYDFEFRVASLESSGAFDLLFDGQRLSSLQVPNSGAWQSWTSITARVSLWSGVHTLRFLTTGGPWNLNWFKAEKSSGTQPNPYPGQGFVGQHGQLRIQGSQLVDQGGHPIQLRGMSSHGLQWFGHYVSLSSMRWLRDDWGITVFRAAMYTNEGGYIQNPSVKDKVKEAIEAAVQLGIYVIVDWHILSDSNPQQYKQQAKEFFGEISASYGKYPNVLYEICNEPNGGVSWDGVIKPYAQEVIAVIRQYDPDNIVIVGTPNYCTDLSSPANNPLNLANTMYTLHFYCGRDGQGQRNNVDNVMGRGLAIFVTEWGTSGDSGDGGPFLEEAARWMDFLRSREIGWTNWSLSTAGESSAALVGGASTQGYWSDWNLTTSGKFVRGRMR